MALQPLNITAGKVITIDDEIALVEALVDSGQIENMINVALEKTATGGLYKSHLMTLGTPLPRVREMLKIALAAVDDMIGKEQ